MAPIAQAGGFGRFGGIMHCMSDPSYACPNCLQPVSAREPLCPHCGVDVVLAAVLAERRALSVLPAEPESPFVGDAMLSRFGEFLMKKGYITAAQLDAALSRQQDLVRGGRRITLGQLLLEMRVMTREQLELASVEQVQELQTALRQVNAQLEQRVADRTRELQDAYRRLTELDKLKSNFISNISHELRTPLTKIKGFHALMQAGDLGPLTEDQLQGMEVMGRGVGELERLIADLIQFATGARGEMDLRLSPIAASTLIASVVGADEARAKRRGVNLTGNVPSGLPRAMGDPERIRWVISQLVDNALKFTPAGGHVTVSAGFVDGRIRWSVADTGVGIPAERLGELFEAFHQLDGSATRKQGGAGIGLSLVKMIVEAHDSRITVESAPGEGSRFFFDLPVAQ